MIELVNALLNVSRLELGTFKVEPKKIEMKKITKEVIKESVAMLEEKEIKIIEKYDEKIPLIKADPDLTRIILQNLITNAIKYTPTGGKVSVEVAIKKACMIVKVSDTGYGIPKSQQKNIFGKLFRADNVKERDTTGTGLGLYMVKSILESVGGKIWFKSVENKGSQFFVSIPLKGMKKKKGEKKLN